jgi:hypothetical protein
MHMHESIPQISKATFRFGLDFIEDKEIAYKFISQAK